MNEHDESTHRNIVVSHPATMTALLLLSLSLLAKSQAVMLNLHLPLHSVKNATELCPYTHALRANLFLKQAFPSTEQVSFMRVHSPHLTLFLTEFNAENTSFNVTSLLDAAQTAVQGHAPCEIRWNSDPVIHGAYAMYPIPTTKCLRSLSSQIVRALQPYITLPQPIPDWVKDLPLLPRLRKMYLIEKFGSPNVFGGYDAHVTVGYDEVTQPDARKVVLERAVADLHDGGRCSATLATIGVAKVGVGGSVLQQGVVGRIELQPKQERTIHHDIVWAKDMRY